jgi:putative acyl-CoA dehydrogenase
MSTQPPSAAYDRFNQSPPYVDVDLYGGDPPLMAAVAANGGDGDVAGLSAFGKRWGSAEMLELARQANENVPKLKTFDAKGFRRDTVEFHPAYHHFMAESVAAGLQGSTWQDNGAPAPAPAQVVRTARFYMAAQVETGHLCPITMTRAAVAALAAEPALVAKLLPKILSRQYDSHFRPWWEKTGITLGMGMTERQGGTDVRTNTTRAALASEASDQRGHFISARSELAGGGYAVTGSKWFMSAPMCDGFLVLAQAPGGLTCFFMPRFRPDGMVNGLHFQRLKDKLGNRSNASSEVEFADAFAWRVGEEGRGVRTIINMVQLTRLDCAIASAGLMRMALAQAIHHTRHRTVFQKHLADQPMMQAVLAAMALEVEAATALVMRLARAFDLAAGDPLEAAYARVLTPAVKYWVCKTAPALIYEAMECLGGNGYVEESVLPRLYREAPVNAIWEGSGNVMCLDVLRALGHERELAQALLDRLAAETAGLPGCDDAVAHLRRAMADPQAEAQARALVERLALLAAAAALRVGAPAPAPVCETFARVRLEAGHGATYGSRPFDDAERQRLTERALPS